MPEHHYELALPVAAQTLKPTTSVAIDKYRYVMVNKTFDHHTRVVYSKVEYVEQIDEIEHNLAREALKLVGINEGGLDIVYMGDMLPAHAGSWVIISSTGMSFYPG